MSSISDPAARSRYIGYALAGALGLVGGYAMYRFGAPLPWFLGPMLATAVFAIAGAPVAGPNFLRPVALPVLGVMLGSAFMPEVFRNALAWSISLGMIPLYIVGSTAMNFTYFRRVAGADRVTAYFASLPGGLNDMVLLGDENGGDVRQIALSHTMRILVSVLFLALVLIVLSDAAGSTATRPVTRLSDAGPRDGALLLGCAVAGPFVGKLLHFPARFMLGPLMLSAIVHLSGAVEIGPPTVLSSAAQFVLGACIGARFAGMSVVAAALNMMHAFVSASLALTLSAAIGLLAVWAAGLHFFEAFLGYAPGGLMEMSLLALAINQSVAYVTIAHTARYVVVMLTAPLFFKVVLRRHC